MEAEADPAVLEGMVEFLGIGEVGPVVWGLVVWYFAYVFVVIVCVDGGGGGGVEGED